MTFFNDGCFGMDSRPFMDPREAMVINLMDRSA